ncbi:MAG TPA: hypothetical protein VGC51_02680 [Hansschlegelia sp.]
MRQGERRERLSRRDDGEDDAAAENAVAGEIRQEAPPGSRRLVRLTDLSQRRAKRSKQESHAYGDKACGDCRIRHVGLLEPPRQLKMSSAMIW